MDHDNPQVIVGRRILPTQIRNQPSFINDIPICLIVKTPMPFKGCFSPQTKNQPINRDSVQPHMGHRSSSRYQRSWVHWFTTWIWRFGKHGATNATMIITKEKEQVVEN